MNRGSSITIFLLALMLACDPSSTVEPQTRNERFFFKLYSGQIAGDDIGVDLAVTTDNDGEDNGLVFVGTSDPDQLGPSEMLVVKTGIDGNEQWKFSSSTNLPGTKIRGNSILALNDGSAIIAGGTTGEFRSAGSAPILFLLDPDGNFLDSLSLSSLPNTDPSKFYELKSITQTHSYIVVSGETDQAISNAGGVNGFIAVIKIDNGALSFPVFPEVTEPITIFGVDGDEIIAGAFEFQDTPENKLDPRFIAFFGTFEENKYDFKFYLFTGFLSLSSGGISDDFILELPDDQIPVAVARTEDTYWILGDGGASGMFYAKWDSKTNRWSDTDQEIIGNTERVEARGIDLDNEGLQVVTGDDANFAIFLAKVGSSLRVNDPWPRLFGNSVTSYSSSAVKVLTDSSIVVLGTADLEYTKKIVLIKTGPNGEMYPE